MNTLAERLKIAREKAGLSQQQVADMAGMKQPAYFKVETGKTQRTGFLTEIAKALNVDAEWLATGEGEMTPQVKEFLRDEPANDVIQRLITNGNDGSVLRSIPFLDAKVACGHGVINDEYPEVLGRYEISEDFLTRLGLPTTAEGLILVESDGDSMKPTIPEKTPLLVNTKEKDFGNLATGKIYVFCADGAMLCKRVFRNLDSTITLRSDNADDYEDVTVNQEKFNEFHILGRVKFAFVEF